MDYLILALATWRLSSLIANESGPYNLFDRLRATAGVYYDDYGNPQGHNELSQMLICIWCSSIWVGIVLTASYWLLGAAVVWFLLPFAVSTIAVIVELVVEKHQ